MPRVPTPRQMTLSGPSDVPGDRQGTGIGVGDDPTTAGAGRSAGFGAGATGAGAGASRAAPDPYAPGARALLASEAGRPLALARAEARDGGLRWAILRGLFGDQHEARRGGATAAARTPTPNHGG